MKNLGTMSKIKLGVCKMVFKEKRLDKGEKLKKNALNKHYLWKKVIYFC